LRGASVIGVRSVRTGQRFSRLVAVCVGAAAMVSYAPLAVSPAAATGIMQVPKPSPTAAQKKINGRLLREIERARHEGDKTPGDKAPGVMIDSKGRALVELRCDVTEMIRTKLRDFGATTVSSLPNYRSILAWVPLDRLEELAGDAAVYSIQPAPQSTTLPRKEGQE